MIKFFGLVLAQMLFFHAALAGDVFCDFSGQEEIRVTDIDLLNNAAYYNVVFHGESFRMGADVLDSNLCDQTFSGNCQSTSQLLSGYVTSFESSYPYIFDKKVSNSDSSAAYKFRGWSESIGGIMIGLSVRKFGPNVVVGKVVDSTASSGLSLEKLERLSSLFIDRCEILPQ